MKKNFWKSLLTIGLVALCVAAADWFTTQSVARQETRSGVLQGAAALEQLKQDGQYDSLQAAMNAARFSVSRVDASPLGRAAWHAPNPAAGYDAYITETGVSLSINKVGNDAGNESGNDALVSLRLHSIGYGNALRTVAPGLVSGDKQTINIEREGLREWFVNGADGLEHGFTLNEPPQSATRNLQSAIPLRLALQVSTGWRAVPSEDGKLVTLRGANDQAVEYGKLVVRDSAGNSIAARLTVANEQVVVEVEDREAVYPLTIDPLFTMQRRFIAFDGRALDLFGYAVALDGDTAIIGAPGADLSNIGGEGAAYIFVRNGGVWGQQAKLTAADGVSGDTFGISVALDGDTALVGATHAEPDSLFPSRGGAYVFVRNGSAWTQQQKLNPADGVTGVRFGAAVALHENTALVGAPEHKLPGTNAATGAAFVFTRSGTQWTQQMRLRANDAATADRFGEAVALDADTALIGAPGDDLGANADHGSAYLFTRNGAAWIQQPRLNHTNPAAGDHFGTAVALAGHTAMIGAPLYGSDDRGKVFTFRRKATGWAQTDATEPPQPVTGGNFGVSVSLSGDLAVIGESLGLFGVGADQRSAYVFETSSDPRLVRRLGLELGAANDRFGYAVAVEGNTVLAGAYRGNVTTSGAAYAYVLHDSRHGERQKLVAADGVANDQFGFALALDGDTLAVGARNERGGQGAVYLFTRTGTAPNTIWTFQQKIFAADAAANDNFGYSVALNGDTLAVGMPLDDISHQDQGSAYIFTRSSGRWTFQTRLHAADSVGHEGFGVAVALEGDTVIVGVHQGKRDPLLSPREGAVYVFTRNGTNWIFQAKLLAPDGEHGDYLGGAVALDGDTAAVGAPIDDIGANVRQGSVYLFTRTGGLWSFRQKLLAEGGDNAEFGRSVALAGVVRSGDTLVVGAPGEKIGENNFQGAAYVFKRTGDSWAQTQKLFDRDGARLDLFGFSVALSGDTLVAGTRPNDRIGAAFVYTRLDQFWYPQPKLTASDGAAGDYFGWAVAVSGDTIAVGASADDSPTQRDQGSVYIYASGLCPPLSIAPASLPNGVTGILYNQQLTGSGGSGVDDYLFSVASGTLPPGLTLTPGTGVLAGTPTVAGTWRFTITTRFGLSLCIGSRTYTLVVTSSCATITVNPATLPNGTTGTMYNQTLTASGGAAPYSYSISAGALPGGLNLAANGALTGMPNASGVFNFTVGVTDANGCTGARAYALAVNGFSGNGGLQFYPLAHPVRLLDTRVGFTGCDAPNAKIAGGTSRHQTAAGRTCDGLTIPANAAALVGNVTTVQSGGGYLTLYPSDIAKPNSANSNYAANQILNNVFTVRLGANDGAFKIFVSTDTDLVVDITGYYAAPSASGLYFHPLPKPVRLLETRAGFSGCFTPGTPLQAGTITTQLGETTCDGVVIPAGAQALVGNATTTNQQANGYMTLYPADAAQPLAASSNFYTGINMNAPFIVGLSPSGHFNIYTHKTTDLVIDVTGYYSTQMNDANGQGLLFNALAGPVRLLDTRVGQSACFTPGAQMTGGTAYTQIATGACANVPATAQAVVGNVTTVNPAALGYLTFWPSNANQPTVATSNYQLGQVFNRHFTVGLGADGGFKRFSNKTTDLVIDVAGYFAP